MKMKYTHKPISAYRDQLGFTQQECATKINVAYQQWQRWESGESIPSCANLCKICEALNMPIFYIEQFFEYEEKFDD